MSARWFCLFLIALLPVSAALKVQVSGTTSTQALLYYIVPDNSPCTIEASESFTFSPLVADLDPALFSGADSDTARNVLPAGTARLVPIGLRTSAQASDGRFHSRALATDTKHYVRVTCGANSGTIDFTTGTPLGIIPEPLPTDPKAWGHLAYPEFDFTDLTKPVIDPRTGLKIYSYDPKGWSMSEPVALTANWIGGAAGWSNPGSITSYGSAVATTANTNPVALYFDPAQFTDQVALVGGYWPYDNFLDMGVDLYGSGTDASADNRIVQLALSLDSGQTPFTVFVNAALPSGADSAAGTTPAAFPSAYFGGWGKALPRNAWPKTGFVTAVGGIVTLTKNQNGAGIGTADTDAGAYFNQDWVPGTKLWINNSGPACVNNFCTIASVQSGARLTLSENLTLAENQYKSAALSVIVRKTNATGSVNLSARLRIARGYSHDMWTGGCASTTVTSGDGIVGYPCIFPKTRQDPGGLYFVGVSTPVIRLASLFVNPVPCCTSALPGHTLADSPSAQSAFLGPSVPTFDPGDPTVMYAVEATNGGAPSLFKIQYTGDWSLLPIAYQSNSITPPRTSELTWNNFTKSSESRDLRTQILAHTTYNETTWPSLSSLQTVGISGKYALFQKSIGSQGSACWIFAFDGSSGNFYRAWRTDDGTSNPGLKYAGCHAVIPIDGGAFLLAADSFRFNNANAPYGGPYYSPVTAVRRGGVFDSSNTALPWPPALPPAVNGYDTTCPADLAQAWKDNGAINDQCVTIQSKEPCSAVPTAGERTASPCPWDANKSMVAALAEGDWFHETAQYDSEGFMVVRKTSLGGGLVQLILQRNANYSYCALGKDGVGGAFQYAHANTWALEVVPRGACASALDVIDIVGNTNYVTNQNLVRGHFAVTSSGAAADTWIGVGSFTASGVPIYAVAFNRLRSNIGQKFDYSIPSTPSFAGFYSGYHDIQSYIDAKQRSATPELRRFAFDFRHYNGGAGVDLERPGQVIGAPTSPVLQSGTASVYKITFTGAAEVKRGVFNLWAAEMVLSEKSSAAAGNVLTDADPWQFCYAYEAGECRAGAGKGDMYAVLPRADLMPQCWASQMNLRTPCAMAGPVQAMRATQVRIDAPDPNAQGQRSLGSLLMGPAQQYVYSNTQPTPDASYLLFGGYLLSGYHTGLMMAKIPKFPDSNVASQHFLPTRVRGTGTSVYIEFGYEEFGPRTSFFCTPRQEACRVAASRIDEMTPFLFAHESLTPATGPYDIAIPAMPGRIVYYRVVDNGVPGPLQADIPAPGDRR